MLLDRACKNEGFELQLRTALHFMISLRFSTTFSAPERI